jgi:hypothetical protein
MLVKDRFTLGADDGDTFAGWHDPSIRWNGFATPKFNLATVRKIKVLFDRWAAEMPDCDIETIDIDKAGRVFIVSEYGRDEVNPSTLTKGENLYSIGSFAWTWLEVSKVGGE